MSEEWQEYVLDKETVIKSRLSILDWLKAAGAPIDGWFSPKVREGYIHESYENKITGQLIYRFIKKGEP